MSTAEWRGNTQGTRMSNPVLTRKTRVTVIQFNSIPHLNLVLSSHCILLAHLAECKLSRRAVTCRFEGILRFLHDLRSVSDEQ